MVDRSKWKPLPPVLRKAVEAFNDWSNAYLLASDAHNTITAPLYHYTNAAGLEGIINNQQIWFTSYAHLNDPSELTFGMSVASGLLKEIGAGSDSRIKIFCDMVTDLFTHENMRSAFGFFIASFSKDGDDLGQWRAYGDNGRGFALGLAPRLFAVEENPKRQPRENVFVAPVVYGEKAGRQHHMPGIAKAVQIVGETVARAADLMQDINIGMPFLDEMTKALIASQMIFTSLTTKHEGYRHEQEVRLMILGQDRNLASHVSTRARGTETVPFIKSDMPIQTKGSTAEIVIGPAAPSTAEEFVGNLLKPFHPDPQSVIRHSIIPYRAS
jgi:hypothetical protein